MSAKVEKFCSVKKKCQDFFARSVCYWAVTSDTLQCRIDMETCIEIWINCYNAGYNRMLVVIKKIINVSDNEAIIIKVIESVDAPSKINDFP